MSTMVDIWVSEMMKIRERCQQQTSARTQAGAAADGETQPRLQQQQKKPVQRATISEATICMLMDRFAPC